MTHNSITGAAWPDAMQKAYRQRWRIIIVAVLAHMIGMFHRAAMAPVADRVMADFNVTAAGFGSLGSVYFYTYAAMQLPSGTLADTLGPRKTIASGLLLSTLGAIVMGIAPSFGVLYLGRLVTSLGVSIVWLSALKLIMAWFRTREIGTVTGLSGMVVNMGQIIAATPLALLVISIGWRMSFVITGVVGFVIMIVNWFIIKDSPAKVGLPSITELDRQAIPQVTTSHDSAELSVVQRFKVVFSNKKLWPLFAMGLGGYGAYATLINNWAVVYLMQVYGMQRDSAADIVLVATVGFLVSGPIAGIVSDRILQRRRLPIILLNAFPLVAFLLLSFWNGGKPPVGALYPLCFFMSFSCGSMVVAFAYVGDVVQPSARGIAAGLVNMGFFIGAAVAQPLFGYILDLGWTGGMLEGVRIYPPEAFQRGLFLCSGLTALGFIGALLTKETYCRPLYSIEG